jgi:probable phosphoglycerate mutase
MELAPVAQACAQTGQGVNAARTVVSHSLPRISLVRHGETAWTISGQHTSRTDIALTDRGEREARDLGTQLQPLIVDAVLTSPLQRARRTAELAGFSARLEIDADLMEWDYGAYEGRRTVDILAERPHWRLFYDGCPGGETAEDVSARADRVIARLRSTGANALLFAHRDFLRILAARWLGLDGREGRGFFLAPASLSRLGYHHDLTEPVIHLWNGGRHQEDET